MRNILTTGAAIRKSLIVPVQVHLLICSSQMPSQHQLADVLRITLRRVEQDFIPNAPDPGLLQLKHILQKKIAALEASQESTPTNPA
jgi:hypothetical protein